MSRDVADLQRVVDDSHARKLRFEAMTRASKLMREAAEILARLDGADVSAAAGHLADACSALAGPRKG